jgi:hypothetical protein
LQTLPGIDWMGAAVLVVEIGDDMSVFGSAQRMTSWVGMCPGNNESTGKLKSGKNAQRQCVGQALDMRICAGCGAKSMCAQGKVSGTEGAPGA